MNYKFIPLVIAAVLIFVVEARAQSSITWGARGLPPGLTIGTPDPATGTARIEGTPTAAGTYSAVVYPIVEGVFGDMTEISFNILPAGLNLPLYHPYTRRTPGKDGAFVALAGGGNRIFGKTANQPAFSGNGQDFTVRFRPSGVSSMDTLVSAATVGNTALAIFRSSVTNELNMPMTTLSGFSSLNGWGFQPSQLPQAAVDAPSNGYALASDSNAFFLVSVVSGFMGMPGSGASSVKIWRRGASSAEWSAPTDFPVSSSVYYFGPASSPVVTVASAGGVLGSVHMMTVEFESSMFTLPGGNQPQRLVLRSTDGGTTWQAVSNAPALTSVAYDTKNARFVGSTPNGVWTSVNGAAAWTRRSTGDVGRIIYSPSAQLLFSVYGGVSAEGATWLPYSDSSYISVPPSPYGLDRSHVFAAGNAVFRSFSTGSASLQWSQQLTKTFVPTASPSNQRGQVNKAFAYEIPVD